MTATHYEHRIVKRGELVPYANNARTHTEQQVQQVAASMREWGFTNPILIDEKNTVVAGHCRLEAAQLLGIDDVPVIVLAGLSDAQRKAYVLADNRLALNAGWDDELLGMELAALSELDFDLDLLGFDEDELANLLNDPDEGLTDEDATPEVPEIPVSVAGDVWVLGSHRVLCGDSTSQEDIARLMAGQLADFCFTSPPYNADLKSSPGDRLEGTGFYKQGYGDNLSSDDYVQFNVNIFNSMIKVAGGNFTCCYNINYNRNSKDSYIDIVAAAKKMVPLVETIVWEKQMAVSLQGDNLTRIYEFIFVFCKGKFSINKNRTECLKNLWKINNVGANNATHKACFPVALVEEGIKNFCPHGGTIIEPFGGSGTTAIAAEKLGCKAHLMELDPKYCDLIVERWQEYTGKQAVHEDGTLFDDRAPPTKLVSNG